MSVAELKELVHRRIDEVEDEALLEDVLRLLKDSDDNLKESGVLYFTEEGEREIREAIRDVEAGNVYTHEEFMQIMKGRIDRHRNG